MSTTRYFKVLCADGSAFHGGRGSWPLPQGKRPGGWEAVEGDLIPCQRGLHVCEIKHLIGWLGPAVFEVEIDPSELIDHEDKLVVRRARLVKQLAWDDTIARRFAADCAERALRRERRAGREPDKRSWDAVKAARAFADGLIGAPELAAAWAAARAAARAAAWGAAWAAARAAAWDAAWGAAWGAAWDAARDAEQKWQQKRLLEYLDGKR